MIYFQLFASTTSILPCSFSTYKYVCGIVSKVIDIDSPDLYFPVLTKSTHFIIMTDFQHLNDTALAQYIKSIPYDKRWEPLKSRLEPLFHSESVDTIVKIMKDRYGFQAQ